MVMATQQWLTCSFPTKAHYVALHGFHPFALAVQSVQRTIVT